MSSGNTARWSMSSVRALSTLCDLFAVTTLVLYEGHDINNGWCVGCTLRVIGWLS
jgi:hypothetical protein